MDYHGAVWNTWIKNDRDDSFQAHFTVSAARAKRRSAVKLVIYDLLGRAVVVLTDRQMAPGYHSLAWDGRRSEGTEVPSGIYIARLVTPEYTKSIKMVLLK